MIKQYYNNITVYNLLEISSDSFTKASIPWSEDGKAP